MNGTVNANLEPTLDLEVTGPTGHSQQIKAVVDTGYNGSISLPFAIIRYLALTPAGSAIVTFGDG